MYSVNDDKTLVSKFQEIDNNQQTYPLLPEAEMKESIILFEKLEIIF